MVIDDLNIVRIPFLEPETNAPLIVDRDRMLTDTAAFQCMQSVAWWNPKIVQRRCSVEHIEFSERTADDRWWEYPRPPSAIQVFSSRVRKRNDHGKM